MTEDKKIRQSLQGKERELETAIRERDLKNVEIVKLQSEIKSLSQILIRDALSARKKQLEESAVGLTEIIRSVLRLTAEPLEPSEVKRMLAGMGFDFNAFSNPSAAVHNTMKRMQSTGELIRDADGKYRLSSFRY
jgi:hypothetical protein